MQVQEATSFYLNRSLEDLPGEVWKDVPGFEGSYQASSLGRVKSLDRQVPHPRLKQQTVKVAYCANPSMKTKT